MVDSPLRSRGGGRAEEPRETHACYDTSAVQQTMSHETKEELEEKKLYFFQECFCVIEKTHGSHKIKCVVKKPDLSVHNMLAEASFNASYSNSP